ncbi:kinase-like domain-containing protein [Nemania sp. FL0031]|nr:kinase-like domain-containing protein [Nemania sp. FL0031]
MATPTREAVCRLCRDFKDWVQQNVEEGIDGTGREANYVSTTKLKTFWSHSRIATIVGLHDEDVNIDTILSSFIQTVSILAYIADDSHSWTEYLVSFYRSETDDHSLPLRTPDPDTNWTLAAHLRRDPKPFRDDPDGCAAWLQFSAHQWKFLPLQLKSSKGIIDRVHRPRTVDPRHIIPITVESELSPRSGRRAKVVKVRPHEASGLPEEPIVFKEYDASRDIDEFMDERSTYNTIENLNRASKYILGYYGCFIQGNKCVLLIEYANQGNLLEFFKGNRFLPRTEKEAQDLWSDLAHLIDGIALLHNGGKHNSSIHHAIKPSNIFVSQVESKPDRFSFKFGNFETSIAIPITESGEATGLDGGGTLMYSAPELCRIYPEVHMEGLVTCQADIWSFGCVLLESGVWMALHERGRIEFRQERVEETLPLIGNSLGKASYAGAFHDGERVLSTVQNKVSKIWALGTPVARLTARMMDFIEREVLRADVGERLTAQQLQAHFREALDESLHLSSPIMPELPSQVVQSRISPRRTPSLFSYQTAVSGGVIAKDWPPRQPAPWTVESTAARRDSFASLTSFQTTLSTRRSIVSSQEVSSSSSIQPRASESVQQLSNRINSTDRVVISSLQEVPATAFDGDPSRTVPSVLAWIPERKREGTPVLEWLEQPLKQVEGRDHYFVFDNSRTMHEHWDDVTRAAEALILRLASIGEVRFATMDISISTDPRIIWGPVPWRMFYPVSLVGP